MDWTPTPSQTVGPYLHLGLTDTWSLSRVAGDGAKGELAVRPADRVVDDVDAAPFGQRANALADVLA